MRINGIHQQNVNYLKNLISAASDIFSPHNPLEIFIFGWKPNKTDQFVLKDDFFIENNNTKHNFLSFLSTGCVKTKEQPSGIRRWRRADEISEPEPGCWICIQNYPHLHLWLCSEFCLGGLIVNNFWTWAWLLDMYSELSPPAPLTVFRI